MIAAAGIVGAVGAQCFLFPKSVADEATKPVAVRVEAIAETMPIGYLGAPLGTVVRVTGVTVDGDTLRTKAAAGLTFLRINTVNGKALEKPILFEFGRAFPRDADQVPAPAPGDPFDYYVHESGSFSGLVTPPKELDIPKAPLIAHSGFHYRRHLSVHAAARKEP